MLGVLLPTVARASHPFGGAAWEMQPEDLRAHGYVEEEYLVSGTANVYDWDAANKAASTLIECGI